MDELISWEIYRILCRLELKKIVLLTFALIVFSTAVVVRSTSPVVSYPTETEVLMEVDLPVHNIDSGKNFSTIQEAINDNETIDGHTILVDAGTYYEDVRVDKSVRLIGEKRDSTIIDGKRSVTPLTISTNNVTISGFTIRNGGKPYEGGWGGVYIMIGHNCVIENNVITNNPSGIEMSGGSYNITITNNTITNNELYGIVIYFGSNNTISGNTIASNEYGIYTVYSTTKIYRNYFINNTTQASTTSSNNSWDNGKEGNYWSDYEAKYPNATELDGSGIWDTPYVIYSSYTPQQDNYPLVPEFPTWTATLLILIILTVAIAIYKKTTQNTNTIII